MSRRSNVTQTSMRTSVQAFNTTKSVVIASFVEYAGNPLSRLIGLLGRRSLPTGRSLLLVPASSIHTWFMLFAIDALFLDREGRVLKVAHSVPPFRVVLAPRRTRSVLELPSGTAVSTNTTAGDVVSISSADNDTLPGRAPSHSP